MKNKILMLFVTNLFIVPTFGQSDKLTFTNTQGSDFGPETYGEELKVESKLNGTIGVPGGGNRSGIITIAPWATNNGGDPTDAQLAFNKNQVYFRSSLSDGITWSSWQKILLESDEFSYLKFVNTQLLDSPPSSYAEEFKLEQKLSGTIGLSGSDRSGLITISPWPSDGSDVPDMQLAFTKGKMYQRSGLPDGTGWSNWERILTESDAVGLGITDELFVSKIGVKTTNVPTGYDLAIDGKAMFEEVKVQLSENWPDHVFKNDYKLKTLEEVEEHINENGHLPEIPSETEVTENGINLGEMNAKLLQKIEELTLYLIEQNKQNQAQQARIEQLEQKISQLENE